jgi:glucose/mannose-6-phosphate isomerase
MADPARSTLIALDDAAARARLDPGGMMRLVTDFPRQCREGWEVGRRFAGELNRPEHLVITGMGGSAVGGALLAALFADRSPACLAINRDYTLPAFVGPRSLVIAASYSGNTEETLSAFEAAAERGAQVVCVTSGGELARRAAERGVATIIIPGGQPPRASLGYLFLPALAIAQRAGAAPDQGADVEAALPVLDRMCERLGPDLPTADNPAKQLASRLADKLPFIHGTTRWLAVAAYRWRTQCNENAKTLAAFNELPEMDHNEICGWADHENTAARTAPVFLRSSLETDRMRERTEATINIISPHAQVEQIWAEGDSPLAQALSAIYFGDFVTVYLALLHGRDPMEIDAIKRLKQVMGGSET